MDQIKNFKDFLRLYNQISDICFTRCTNTFNSREIESDENNCINICTQKFIRINHKIMEIYMEVQPILVQKRIEDMSDSQLIIDKKKEIII